MSEISKEDIKKIIDEGIDIYETLKINKNEFTKEKLKKNYRELAKKFHPDKSDNKNAQSIFELISLCKIVLENDELREMYDDLKEENEYDEDENNDDYSKLINDYKTCKNVKINKASNEDFHGFLRSKNLEIDKDYYNPENINTLTEQQLNNKIYSEMFERNKDITSIFNKETKEKASEFLNISDEKERLEKFNEMFVENIKKDEKDENNNNDCLDIQLHVPLQNEEIYAKYDVVSYETCFNKNDDNKLEDLFKINISSNPSEMNEDINELIKNYKKEMNNEPTNIIPSSPINF